MRFRNRFCFWNQNRTQPDFKICPKIWTIPYQISNVQLELARGKLHTPLFSGQKLHTPLIFEQQKLTIPAPLKPTPTIGLEGVSVDDVNQGLSRLIDVDHY